MQVGDLVRKKSWIVSGYLVTGGEIGVITDVWDEDLGWYVVYFSDTNEKCAVAIDKLELLCR